MFEVRYTRVDGTVVVKASSDNEQDMLETALDCQEAGLMDVEVVEV